MSAKKISENQILLTFANKDIADYVRLVCRRKGTDLESYIVDNFEWDGMPNCIFDNEKPSKEVCEDCDNADRCPDVVK